MDAHADKDRAGEAGGRARDEEVRVRDVEVRVAAHLEHSRDSKTRK